MITLRAPDDISSMLAAAKQATGASHSRLVLESIRFGLTKAVERLTEERQKGLQTFEEFRDAPAKFRKRNH